MLNPIIYKYFPNFSALSDETPGLLRVRSPAPAFGQTAIFIQPLRPTSRILSSLISFGISRFFRRTADTSMATSKVAMVTGGTRGIGYAISRQLAAYGYSLILGFNSNSQAAESAKNELELTYSTQVYTVKGDVALPETVNAFFECLEKNFEGQPLTALVHNAGLYVGMTTDATSEQAQQASEASADFLGDPERVLTRYDYYQNVYPKCFIRCVTKAAQHMKDGRGYIVAISSPGCNATMVPRVSYMMPGTGKTGIEFLARYYAKLLAPRQITVNVVIPGFIKTESWDHATASVGGTEGDSMKERIKNSPMQRWGEAKEIGQVVAFLCSEKASFITGVALPIDGGLHLV